MSFKELEADCKEAGCIKYQNREKNLFLSNIIKNTAV